MKIENMNNKKKEKESFFLSFICLWKDAIVRKYLTKNRFKKKKKRYITIMRKVNKMCGHGKYCDQKNNQIII